MSESQPQHGSGRPPSLPVFLLILELDTDVLDTDVLDTDELDTDLDTDFYFCHPSR